MKQLNDNAFAEKGFYKLSWLQRIGFGSGDLAQNLIFQTTCLCFCSLQCVNPYRTY